MSVHERAKLLASILTDRPDPSIGIEAAKYRDGLWNKAGITLTKSMDLYSTTPDAAKTCVKSLHAVMTKMGKDLASYQYVEPSAGAGSFLKWLPDDTIAMDILPRHSDVMKCEFLTWEPPESDRPRVVVGAPPLGNYSDVSVAFVNHSLEFADVVGMVVRRHIGNRQIRGRHLYTMPLDRDAVRDLTGGPVPYLVEWRVWQI